MSAPGGDPQGDSVPEEARIAAIRERVALNNDATTPHANDCTCPKCDRAWLLDRLAACGPREARLREGITAIVTEFVVSSVRSPARVNDWFERLAKLVLDSDSAASPSPDEGAA